MTVFDLMILTLRNRGMTHYEIAKILHVPTTKVRWYILSAVIRAYGTPQ